MCAFTDDGVCKLVDGLRSAVHLRVVDITGTHACGRASWPALGARAAHARVALAGQLGVTQRGMAALASMLVTNSTIDTLKLNCASECACAPARAHALLLARVCAACDLGDAEVCELANAIAGNATLQTLMLFGAPTWSRGGRRVR